MKNTTKIKEENMSPTIKKVIPKKNIEMGGTSPANKIAKKGSGAKIESIDNIYFF